METSRLPHQRHSKYSQSRRKAYCSRLPGMVLGCLLASVTVAADLDERAQRGRDLHDSVCHGCHGEEMYNRPGIPSNPYLDLRRQTQLWLSVVNIQWRDDEIADVVHYLQSTYYKRPK